jgi:hypothetical protein
MLLSKGSDFCHGILQADFLNNLNPTIPKIGLFIFGQSIFHQGIKWYDMKSGYIILLTERKLFEHVKRNIQADFTRVN